MKKFLAGSWLVLLISGIVGGFSWLTWKTWPESKDSLLCLASTFGFSILIMLTIWSVKTLEGK